MNQVLGRFLLNLRLKKQILVDNALGYVAAVLYPLSEIESFDLSPSRPARLRRLFLLAKGVCLKGGILVGGGFRLYKTKHHRLSIGKDTLIGENAGIYVHDDIVIGNNFIAAPGLTINNGSHRVEDLEPNATKLIIGDNVWCAVNVTVVSGAYIGDGCVIGANSLVNSYIPPYSLAYGTPARVIRTIQRKDGSKLWNSFSS